MMDMWAEATKIFIFGFSSVFLILGTLSLSVVLTRVLFDKFGKDPKKS